MKTKKKTFSEMVKKNLDFIILAFIAFLVFALSSLRMFEKLDYRIYDSMLHVTKDVPEDNDIVLVDIEDESLSRVGSWPWPRNILADTLIRMKELGAAAAVFDIEYISESDRTLSPEYEMMGQRVIDNAKKTEELDLEEFAKQYENAILMDNDKYFAQALQFFENASLTVNVRNISIREDDENKKYVKNRFLFDCVEDPEGLIPRDNERQAKADNGEPGFIPAIGLLSSHCSGVGFTNVVVDSDGTRRRVELLNEKDGKYIGQLSFAPLMRMLGAEKMVRTKQGLDVYYSDKSRISIPLDSRGRMLVNWVHKKYPDSFAHCEVFRISELDEKERQIFRSLGELQRKNPEYWTEDEAEVIGYAGDVLAEYWEAWRMKFRLLDQCQGFDRNSNPIGGGILPEEYDEYFTLRANFFADVNDLMDLFLSVNPEREDFIKIKTLCQEYDEGFGVLKNLFNGAFCIIGNSATGSTDLGVMPFDPRNPNVGTHANVVNTILQKKFIREIDALWGILFAFAVAMAVLFAGRKLSPGKRTFLSVIYVVIVPVVLIALMAFFRIYVPMSAAMSIVIASFLAELVLNLNRVEDDKKFLKSTFGSYVAPAIVDEIIKSPEAATLGGRTGYLTALFSDVKTFSGFTEIVNKTETENLMNANEALPANQRKTAEQVELEGAAAGAKKLVHYLNEYLGALTDELYLNHGTVDKYVGDEIVSFFGAPIDDPNNAYQACLAAIAMRKAEDRYNREHESELPLDADGKPFYLHSRIGLNTGNMIVGNMGTDQKMNYTVMGNNVNLASRLEGINKVYGSWIICSESTYNDANGGENQGKILFRKFDKVRVVNVRQPVPIYNVLCLMSEAEPERIKAAKTFNEGMDIYLKGSTISGYRKSADELKLAYLKFKEAKELYPADESSQVFMARCAAYVKNGIPEKWDGVYTMTSK